MAWRLEMLIYNIPIAIIYYNEGVRFSFHYSSEPNAIALPDDCVTHMKLKVAI